MRLRRPLTVLLALSTALALAAPVAAQESPQGPSSAEVARRLAAAGERLDELEAQQSLAVEEVNAAQVALDEAEAELAEVVAEAQQVAAAIGPLRQSTDAVARSLYKGGGASLQFASLLSSTGVTEAGSRYATVQRVLRDHRGEVQALQAARTRLAELERRAEELRDEAAERRDELAGRRDELEAMVASQADEIARLERELRAAREREEAARRAEEARLRAEAEARRRAAAAAAAQAAAARRPASITAASAAPSAPSAAPSAPAPATRRSAQVAVDTALAQVGKPYRWGGGGPSSFDCSGLTSFAWRAAGVSLPHSSRAQMGATRRISRSELQPGDLVFFGSPVHHVAMYIGGGKVVEASRAGVPVRVSSTALGRRDIAGYGRP